MNKTTVSTLDNDSSINTNPFTRCFNGLDQLFKYNQGLAIVILIISVVSGIFQFIPSFFPGEDSSPPPANTGYGNDMMQVNVAAIMAIILGVLLVLIILAAISTYINGITNYVAWKTSRHESTTFSEAIREVTKRFWTIFAVQIMVFFRVLGGFLLLVIPGIRAALRYQMVLFPVFDEGLNASHAIKRIKELTKGHLIEIFGIMTVATVIPFIGLLLQMGGEAVMYPELKHVHEKGLTPKVHWLNYLGLFLVVFFILLGIFIAVAIGAATGNFK